MAKTLRDFIAECGCGGAPTATKKKGKRPVREDAESDARVIGRAEPKKKSRRRVVAEDGSNYRPAPDGTADRSRSDWHMRRFQSPRVQASLERAGQLRYRSELADRGVTPPDGPLAGAKKILGKRVEPQFRPGSTRPRPGEFRTEETCDTLSEMTDKKPRTKADHERLGKKYQGLASKNQAVADGSFSPSQGHSAKSRAATKRANGYYAKADYHFARARSLGRTVKP